MSFEEIEKCTKKIDCDDIFSELNYEPFRRVL